MPLARIITSTPSAAKDLAQALSDSGYIVDIVSPYRVPASAVDLEINLDLQIETSPAKAVAPQTDIAQAFADSEAEELPGHYVVQREFVLAPMWRKVTAHLRDKWSELRPQRSIRSKPIAEIPSDSRYELLRAKNLEARKRVSKRFSHAQSSASRTAQRAQTLIREYAARINDGAAALALQAKARVALLTSEFAARVQQSRAKAPALVTPPDADRDRFIYRQLWPVAAGASLAFIVGFIAASYTKMPVLPAEQAAIATTGATAIANPVRAMKLRKPKAAKAVLPRPSAVVTRKAVYDPDADDEVVVRHYPSKSVTAKNQNQGPKRFSDLQ